MRARDAFGLVIRLAGGFYAIQFFIEIVFVAARLLGIPTGSEHPLAMGVFGLVVYFIIGSVLLIGAERIVRLFYGPDQRDKMMLSIEDMPDWLIELVTKAKMAPRHDPLDHVVAPEDFEQSDASSSLP